MTLSIGKEEAAEWQTVKTPDQTAPLNPLYNGRFFHCNILDGSICNFRDVRYYFLFYFIFDAKTLLANIDDPDQLPHGI